MSGMNICPACEDTGYRYHHGFEGEMECDSCTPREFEEMSMEGTFVAFDFETGGLEDRHPEIQLAAIAVEEWAEVAVFEAKIQFCESLADPEALKLNRYDAEVWSRDSRPENRVVAEFADFLKRHAHLEMVSKNTGRPYKVARLCGHNAATFDAPRLQRMFKRHRAFLPASFQVLDTIQLALWRSAMGQTFPSFALGMLCNELGIESDGAHDALADVRMCVEVARRLTAVQS